VTQINLIHLYREQEAEYIKYDWCRCQPDSTYFVSCDPTQIPTLIQASLDGADARHSVPPKLQFETDGLEQTWSFINRFDFIHSRVMTGSFVHWPKFIMQTFEYTHSPA
jgi:hypothetical protein